MNTEQLRAEFEAKFPMPDNCQWCGNGYAPTKFNAWEAQSYADKFEGWKARSALQSQSNHDTTLFCDLKTDEEKCAFFLSGRGYETGVIAHAIQNDVAMAYHRCSEYRKEAEALQAECDRLNRYYKNGIDCFANPCERHSGERTPPLSEFFEKYGGQCLICVVDNNKALKAENERLRKDAERYRYLSSMATQQADSLGPIFRIDVRRSAPYPFNFDAAVDLACRAEEEGNKCS